uniref:5'-nucleotidase n=1 Tax=Sus scrofa TaxID=9823 RepID=A0A8D0XXI1_PIG
KEWYPRYPSLLAPSPSFAWGPQARSSHTASQTLGRAPAPPRPAPRSLGPASCTLVSAPSLGPAPAVGDACAVRPKGRSLSSRRRPAGKRHGGGGEAGGGDRPGAGPDPPGAPRPPSGRLGSAASPRPVDAQARPESLLAPPAPPARPCQVPPGPSAVSGSVVLSDLGTGEPPDEGHGPDAAARAGAGDRGRPPQGRRRPLTDILDNSKIISEECRKELKALLHHYYPIEIDPDRTVKEKLPHMVEWWTKAHDLLCQQKIQKFQIAQVVRESSAMLRDGYKTFFHTLSQNHVPLLIFSAGIGDVLEEIIRQRRVFHPNIHVVSNYMEFDEEGFLKGFKGQLIHTYNKNSSVCENSTFFQQLQGKTNILLLGDSLGDLTMADGVPGVENILKIGFLNDKVEEWRERYMDFYDIVLEKDETLDVVNGLLQHILQQEDWTEMQGP